MTTNDVVKALAQKLGISQARARTVLHELLQDWTAHLAAGDTVYMAGLGKFQVQLSKLRRNYIPGKEAWCVVPPRRRVVFKTAAPLKNLVRNEVSE